MVTHLLEEIVEVLNHVEINLFDSGTDHIINTVRDLAHRLAHLIKLVLMCLKSLCQSLELRQQLTELLNLARI